MDTLSFTVPGEVVGKGRHRTTFIGGAIRTYTPAKTVNFENKVALFFQQQYPDWEPRDQAFKIVAEIHKLVPKSYTAKKRKAIAEGRLLPTGKPDPDNVVKGLLDGLNGGPYVDDRLCVDQRGYKVWGDVEKVIVTITFVGEPNERKLGRAPKGNHSAVVEDTTVGE